MIEHVVEILQPVVDEVIVVKSQSMSLPALDARVVEDRDAECGPLSGIRDGLESAKSDLAFVTSTDSPFLTSHYVTEMLDRGCAVAPREGGHIQVLSAVYPGSAWREANDLLESGQRRPLRLLERVGFEAIEWGDMQGEQPTPWQGFNTPDEYLFWARSIDPKARAHVELLGRSALKVESRDFDVPIGCLGDVLDALQLPKTIRLIEDGKLAKSYLVSLGGRDLVRRLDVPVGPGERVSVIDALAGG